MSGSSSVTARQVIILAMIVLAGGYARFSRIGGPSLWMDELLTAELAMGNRTAHDFLRDSVIRKDQPDFLSLDFASPWWRIWNRLQITTHPPLHFVILRWWMDVFGTRPAALRALSALFSLAAVVVMFDVCRLLHGARLGLYAAAIMALAPAQIDFAQEARSYALLILLGLASCDLLVRVCLHGARGWRLALLWVFLAAVLLTHYFGAGAFVALAVFAVIRLDGRGRRAAVGVFVGAAAFYAIVWGEQFYRQFRTVPNFDPSYVRDAGAGHWVHLMAAAAQLPLKYTLGDRLSLRLPMLANIAATAFVIVLVCAVARRKEFLIWILWGAGIILSVVAIDIARHSLILQYSRYTILASPALYAIVAGVGIGRGRRAAQIIPATVIVSLIIAAGMRTARGVPPKEDFHQLATIIDTYAAPNELLVFYNDSGWVSPGVWYIGYKYYSPSSDHPWATLRHAPDERMVQEISGRKTFWLIGPAPEKFGSILFPGWRPTWVWHTTAGSACIMSRQGDGDSVR